MSDPYNVITGFATVGSFACDAREPGSSLMARLSRQAVLEATLKDVDLMMALLEQVRDFVEFGEDYDKRMYRLLIKKQDNYGVKIHMLRKDFKENRFKFNLKSYRYFWSVIRHVQQEVEDDKILVESTSRRLRIAYLGKQSKDAQGSLESLPFDTKEDPYDHAASTPSSQNPFSNEFAVSVKKSLVASLQAPARDVNGKGKARELSKDEGGVNIELPERPSKTREPGSSKST